MSVSSAVKGVESVSVACHNASLDTRAHENEFRVAPALFTCIISLVCPAAIAFSWFLSELHAIDELH